MKSNKVRDKCVLLPFYFNPVETYNPENATLKRERYNYKYRSIIIWIEMIQSKLPLLFRALSLI